MNVAMHACSGLSCMRRRAESSFEWYTSSPVSISYCLVLRSVSLCFACGRCVSYQGGFGPSMLVFETLTLSSVSILMVV